MLTKELGYPNSGTLANWRDYYALTKPRVVQLLVFTTMVGMFMARRGMVAWHILVLGSLGIGRPVDTGMKAFGYSIGYPMVLFSFLLIDHYILVFWPT